MAQIASQQTGPSVGRAGGRETAHTLAVLALPALTMVLGLQLLRVLIPTLYSYLGEAQGVSTMNLGVVALALFGLAFLAGPVRRFLGPRLALAITAGGVALMRVLEQFIPAPGANFVLSAIGTLLFLWFLPIYLGRVRGRGPQATVRYAQAIVLGLALDAGIQGAAGTYDLVWQPGLVTAAAVAVLAGLQLFTLARAWLEAPAEHSDGRLLPTLVLTGLGPFLALQVMLLQSTAAWAALTGWQLPLALAGNLISYAVALALGAVLAARVNRHWWPWLLLGMLTLAVLMAPPQRGALAALRLFAGQVLAAGGLIVIFKSLGERADRTGLWRTMIAYGAGMLLFVLSAFLYFASYWIHLPFESTAVLPAAAALFGVCVVGATAGLPQSEEPRTAGALAPAWAALALLIFPLVLALTWHEPVPVVGQGGPVRVMQYNLHHGFNTDGRMDLEALARNVEQAGADVVGLEEVTRGWYLDGSPDMVGWLSRRLGMPYVYAEAVDPYFGNVILSRFPIKNSGRGSLPRTAWEMRRSYAWAQLDLGGGEDLLFVTAHTHHVEGQGDIRMPQMAELLRFWNQRPRTVIVGDLNALPDDPEIALFANAGLRDAFTQAGSGDGFTSEADHPRQRIDYIWLSPDLQASDYATIQSTASDHFPVAVTVR